MVGDKWRGAWCCSFSRSLWQLMRDSSPLLLKDSLCQCLVLMLMFFHLTPSGSFGTDRYLIGQKKGSWSRAGEVRNHSICCIRTSPVSSHQAWGAKVPSEINRASAKAKHRKDKRKLGSGCISWLSIHNQRYVIPWFSVFIFWFNHSSSPLPSLLLFLLCPGCKRIWIPCWVLPHS